jgi:hypothetical protein
MIHDIGQPIRSRSLRRISYLTELQEPSCKIRGVAYSHMSPADLIRGVATIQVDVIWLKKGLWDLKYGTIGEACKGIHGPAGALAGPKAADLTAWVSRIDFKPEARFVERTILAFVQPAPSRPLHVRFQVGSNGSVVSRKFTFPTIRRGRLTWCNEIDIKMELPSFICLLVRVSV